MSPVDRPTLVYDGDCGFCRRCVERVRRQRGEAVDVVPLQEAEGLGLPRADLERAVHLVEPDGRVTRAMEAVLRVTAVGWLGRLRLAAYQRSALVRGMSERLYAFVARHRVAASRVARLLYGPTLLPSEYVLARWIFLRLLAVVYAVAFLSARVQLDGIFGNEGIAPIAPGIQNVKAQIGGDAWLQFPTLALWHASDGALHAYCLAGLAFSVVLAIGLVPRLALAALWALYLSLVVAGQQFFSFQWDVLLLEAGALAFFLAPWRPLPSLARAAPPSRAVVLLFHWLVFRLMFTSGMVKLTVPLPEGMENVWLTGKALTYHYETQPLPNPLSWWVHNLPAWFHEVSLVAMFGVELVLPFLIFLPRRLRHLAGLGLIALQVLIFATGNYGFFNVLSIALCVMLFDDVALGKLVPVLARRVPERLPRAGRRWRLAWRPISVPAAVLLVLLSGGAMLRRIDSSLDYLKTWTGEPTWLGVIERHVYPFRSINAYGLFAHMTTERPELVIEGSADGVEWLPYELPWKPGPLDRRPGQVAPHMPRLDWQLWFAAMGPWQSAGWVQALLVRLLEGDPAVLALFEKNPFPDAPPKHVRVQVYDYRFTTPEERAETGDFWKRGPPRAWCPVRSLR